MKSYLILYLKGLLMGLADLVPGISGGTIAFITGIYQRLITTIGSISIKQISSLMNFKKNSLKKISQLFVEYNYDFLLILVFGIITAILLGATGISYLFEHYTNYTLAFFIGLIISSCIFINKTIEKKSKSNLLIIGGFFIGSSLLFLNPTTTLSQISPYYLFLTGVIASSAMILPGISGSFILLILGVYPIILSYASNPLNFFTEILIFITGFIVGVFVLAKILKTILDTHKNSLMSFLLGLVIGATLIPLNTIISSLEFFSIPYLLTFFSLGIIIGSSIEKLSTQ